MFFQMPSALVAADAFRRGGLSTLWSPLLADVARRTRLSVWQVLAQVTAALRHRTPPLMPTFGLVNREVAAHATGAVHRWVTLAREAGVTPAKALQIKVVMSTCMLGFGVAKNNTALKDKLDALIRQDLKNGELNTIYKKYHGADLPKDVMSEGA